MIPHSIDLTPEQRLAQIVSILAQGALRPSSQRLATNRHGPLLPEEVSELVILCFAAMNSLEIQRMAENKGDFVLGAEIGEPVPGEYAFAADNESIAELLDRLEKRVGLGGEVLVKDDGALVVADAEVHRLGM